MAVEDLSRYKVRVELRWWAVPLMVLCTPFALLAALFDGWRALNGLANAATLGARVYDFQGRRLPAHRERARAREELLRRL